MTARISTSLLLLVVFLPIVGSARAELPNITSVAPDLVVPAMVSMPPAPGRRVRQTASNHQDSNVYHCLYLPTDWRPGRNYPVIVEYAGNGPFRNESGDLCTGRVEDCKLGYGISGGQRFIWVCLPFISVDRHHNQLRWWGDVEATVDYCNATVASICSEFGGDPSALLLAGFSRGSIACNFIGLHDDQIAALWRGFICHSHYDGVRKWDYPESEQSFAVARLQRLANRPQFISHERSVEATREYLSRAYPTGNFSFCPLPYRNHTDGWVLRDIPERRALRKWVADTLKKPCDAQVETR